MTSARRVRVGIGFLVVALLAMAGGLVGARWSAAGLWAGESAALLLYACGLALLFRSRAVGRYLGELEARVRAQDAEFESYKRRARKEAEEAELRALEKVLLELLPPFDNLRRAIAAGRRGGDPAALLAGIELVEQQLLGGLARLAVTPIDAVGEPFDPRFHEALQMVDAPDVPPGQVVEQYQRGYLYTPLQRLLRPAKVAVAKAAAPPDAPAAATEAAAPGESAEASEPAAAQGAAEPADPAR
jgi:molecular chaperone GrpE